MQNLYQKAFNKEKIIMLELKNIRPALTISNESDYWVKMIIKFVNKEHQEGITCYWSAIGQDQSLLEIGLRDFSGEIYKIVLLVPPTTIYQEENFKESKNCLKKNGIPCFKLNNWATEPNPLFYDNAHYQKNYYIREKQDFQVIVTNRAVSIIFSRSEVILQVINDFIIFGFNKDNMLCSIRMENTKFNEEDFLTRL